MSPLTRRLPHRFTPFLLAILLAGLARSPTVAASVPAEPSPAARQDSLPKVWVNTASGVYHCSGTRYYGTTKAGIYLTEAQARTRGYRPASGQTCAARSAIALTKEKVWVNTSTGVYHCAGTRYYGKTKAGKFLPESEARSAGYRPAYGRSCAAA
jgi:hypothetical protein